MKNKLFFLSMLGLVLITYAFTNSFPKHTQEQQLNGSTSIPETERNDARVCLNISDVENDLLSIVATLEPLPSGYTPRYTGYSQLKHYYDASEDEHYYIYDFPSAAEVDADVECISQWHGDESSEDVGCYNPGSDCRGFITPDGTVIICC